MHLGYRCWTVPLQCWWMLMQNRARYPASKLLIWRRHRDRDDAKPNLSLLGEFKGV